MIDEQDKQIVEEWEAGATPRSLAFKFNLSIETIRKIIRRYKQIKKRKRKEKRKEVKMTGINIYKGEEDLKDTGDTVAIKNKDGSGHWEVARYAGYSSLIHRIKCAWLVFQEKADIVIWKNQ